MSLLAEQYHDDGERSRVMGTAMGGIAVGVLSKWFQLQNSSIAQNHFKQKQKNEN